MSDLMRTAPPAEAAPYRPVSALAVAALIVAGLNALILIGFGIAALISHRPFLHWSVILLSAVAIGLSLTAKLRLARAQGTRAGGGLATAALLLSLIFGLGYLSYSFAIDFAIRKQGQEVAERFLKLVFDGEFERAFMMTMEPRIQRTMPDDPEAIRRRFGNTELNQFLRSELPRLARSWTGRSIRTFDGVRDWKDTPQGFECELNFTIRVPEGVFPAGVTTLAVDDPDTGQRSWQVLFGKTGLRQADRKLTTLGKLITDLQYHSFHYLREWHKEFIHNGPAAATKLIRIDGVMPPEAKRMEIAESLMQPEAVTLYPGGPLRPLGNATVMIQDDGITVSHVIEVTAMNVGSDLNSLLILRVRGDELVNEMKRLAGPGWENQPINTSQVPEATRFEFTFEPIEINIRPTTPRIGPRPISIQSTPNQPDSGKEK